MKHLKMLGLSAVAATALTAFVGAGTASATSTELYTGHATQGAGLTIHATLNAGTTEVLADTSGSLADTCEQSTLHGRTGQATVTGGEITLTVEAITWIGCVYPTITQSKGTLDITNVNDVNGDGIGDGTVTGTGNRVTVLAFGFADCVYGTGAGKHLGTLLGSTSGHATLGINAVINLQEGGFGCPATTRWTADYTVTTPTGLNVRD